MATYFKLNIWIYENDSMGDIFDAYSLILELNNISTEYVLLGISTGCIQSIYLTTREPRNSSIKALILISPLFTGNNNNNNEKSPFNSQTFLSIQCPTFLIHGKKDK